MHDGSTLKCIIVESNATMTDQRRLTLAPVIFAMSGRSNIFIIAIMAVGKDKRGFS